MEVSGARVEIRGPILRPDELAAFAAQLKQLHTTLAGKAELAGIEPNLRVLLEGNGLGRIAATVDLTLDQLNQSHRFRFDTDQTWIGPMLTALEAVLDEHPVRGSPPD